VRPGIVRTLSGEKIEKNWKFPAFAGEKVFKNQNKKYIIISCRSIFPYRSGHIPVFSNPVGTEA
jgi:hypothetical protein